MKSIAWNGLVADYTDAELKLMHELVHTHEAVGEVTLIHEAKALLGATLVEEEEASVEPGRSGTATDAAGPVGDAAPATAVAPSPSASVAARDEAIARVDAHADPQFKQQALDALQHVARTSESLTSDDVWLQLPGTAREPRVMGPVMLAGRKRGWIEPTDQTRQATRVVNHARPQRVWRSLIYEGGNA